MVPPPISHSPLSPGPSRAYRRASTGPLHATSARGLGVRAVQIRFMMTAAAVLVGALAGCSSGADRGTDPPSDTTRYASHGVTFDYPASWENQGSFFDEDQTLWQFAKGPHGEANGYVEVLAFGTRRELTATEVQRFGDWFFEFTQNDAMKDRPEGAVEQTIVADVPALQMRWSRPDGAAKRAVVFANGDIVYSIDCYISPRDAGHVAEACGIVIESFTFSD